MPTDPSREMTPPRPHPPHPRLNTQPLMEQDSYAERRGCDSCPKAIASDSADCTGSRLPTRRGTLCRLARGLARVLVRQFFPQGTIARERHSSAGLSPPMRDLSAAWQAGSMSWIHTVSYPLRWPFWVFLSPLRTSSPPHSHLMILVKKEKQSEGTVSESFALPSLLLPGMSCACPSQRSALTWVLGPVSSCHPRTSLQNNALFSLLCHNVQLSLCPGSCSMQTCAKILILKQWQNPPQAWTLSTLHLTPVLPFYSPLLPCPHRFQFITSWFHSNQVSVPTVPGKLPLSPNGFFLVKSDGQFSVLSLLKLLVASPTNDYSFLEKVSSLGLFGVGNRQ